MKPDVWEDYTPGNFSCWFINDDNGSGFMAYSSIATGFSGHNFKFSSVVRDILSDLAIYGKTNLPIDFSRISRFNR